MDGGAGVNVAKLVVEALLSVCADQNALRYLVTVDLAAEGFLADGFVPSDPLRLNCVALYQWYLKRSCLPELARSLRKLHSTVPEVHAVHVALCPHDAAGQNGAGPHLPCCVDGDVFIDRENVIDALDQGWSRVLVVRGPPESGRFFCGRIVRHFAQRDRGSMVWVDLRRTLAAGSGPDEVVRAIARQVGLDAAAAPAQEHRDPERWAQALVDWLVGMLRKRSNGERWWMVVAGFDGRPGEELTRSVLLCLAEAVQMMLPDVRLCLLGFDASIQRSLRDQVELLTLTEVSVPDLTRFYRKAFEAHGGPADDVVVTAMAEGVIAAWRATKPEDDETPMEVLRRLAIDAARRCGLDIGRRLR